MEPITVTVPAEYIAVLRLFAAKDNYRVNLNGILVEARRNAVCLVATDGHRLGAFHVASTSSITDINAIIPNSLLAKVQPKKGRVSITLSDTYITLTQGSDSASGEAINGPYPNWRWVVPKRVSGDAGQFNPLYIGDLHKAAKLLGVKESTAGVTVTPNGTEKPALITFAKYANFVGVIMPWRAIPCPEAPGWVFNETGAQAEAA